MRKEIDKTMALLGRYPDLMRRLAEFPPCNCTNNTDDSQLCRRCQLLRFAELRVGIMELEAENERLKAVMVCATGMAEDLIEDRSDEIVAALGAALKEKHDDIPHSP